MSDSTAPLERDDPAPLPPLPPDSKERRSVMRTACESRLTVRLHIPCQGGEVETSVHDLSERGIGLDARKPLDIGTTVLLDLGGVVSMPARVVHATGVAEGAWQVGCLFEHRVQQRSSPGDG
jgi:hypothetical protein